MPCYNTGPPISKHAFASVDAPTFRSLITGAPGIITTQVGMGDVLGEKGSGEGKVTSAATEMDIASGA